MAMAAGAVMRIAGGITGGISANKNRKRYEEMMNRLPTPDVAGSERDWFKDLEAYYPQANAFSDRARADELRQSMALRESALPGIGQATNDAMASIAPLLRGELPASVMSNFMRAGGAQAAGSGFGGSGYGALTTGLFGARGSLGAITQGMGLLPSLLQSMPQISAPTTSNLLSNLMTPSQRVNLTMALRGQQIGINNTLASMPTALDSWSSHLNESGAMLLGGGMGGSGMSGGQSSFGRPSSTGYGPTGNWQSPTVDSYSNLTGANRLWGGGGT